MVSKSQSPGPNPTTSQPEQARSRKAAVPAEQSGSVAGRVGTAGGVVLEKGESGKKVAKAGSAVPAAPNVGSSSQVVAKDAASKDKGVDNAPAASTAPTRQRRRPRKLNKEPLPTDDLAVSSTATAAPAAASPSIELEALKSRVRELEAKVEELYKSSEGRNRSPRRRGKGRKNSSAQTIPTVNSAEADEAKVDEDLVRLESELESARRDLEVYQPRRPKAKRSPSEDTEAIEEIPRGDGEQVLDNEGRQVTLTGSYRIPLPSTLNTDDVKTIQSGISAAQNVARSFLEQRRAAQAARSTAATPPARPTTATRKPSRKASGLEVTREPTSEGKSWSEWFGGYSMAISRAVKSIEAEAAIESQRAPGAASGARRASAKRPAARGRQSA